MCRLLSLIRHQQTLTTVAASKKSQRQHLAVRVDAPAQGGQSAPPVQRTHVDVDTGGRMRDVAAAGQHLQSSIAELLGINTKKPKLSLFAH